MFDEQMRWGKEQVLGPLARPLLRFPPWLFSLLGLGMGIAAAAALVYQAYGLGFLFWFLNRLFDGLDGTVARLKNEKSDLGGYLDILLDFIIYAIIPISLVLGQPSPAAYLSLVVLLAVFYVNAASWMYLAAILEKRSQTHTGRLTSVHMPAGIIGGTETIILYTFFIFWPGWLVGLFYLMAGLVAITIVQRLIWAVRHLA
ncbi:MAG: CDP-alcohol phosphatidyltransferase family protein [Chloroflexi bacterium]|nr:CDP-alcohol phosphatidyltransferase family protein [Chloroflexota bacterium]